MATDVWEESQEVEAALRNAWSEVFREGVGSAVKTVVGGQVVTAGGTISLGILPLTLVGMTLASVVGVGFATAAWALPRFLDLAAKRRAAERNGLHYLMKLKRAA